MVIRPTALIALGSALAIAGCSGDAPNSEVTPSPAGHRESAPPAPGMVASANPAATAAGLDVLRRGGDAVDAAIAVQTVLGLVEPQSSGIGGGAFMVRYDAITGGVLVYDGRETAPGLVDETLFLDEEGSPRGWRDVWRTGQSTGVPGVIAMLNMAHATHGTRPWAENFEPAITLATDGFEAAPRLNWWSARMAGFTDIEETGDAASYLFDEAGDPWPVGTILTNADYADSLRAIAEDWRSFYEGPLAEAIVARVNQGPDGGVLSLDDMANYEPKRHAALCSRYRVYQVCSAPPPSSGGVALGLILGILDYTDMSAHSPDTIEGWHAFIEASRLGYADRDRYVGDPSFAEVPVDGLLDRAYLGQRAALIDPQQAIAEISAGVPDGAPDAPEDTTVDNPGTSHFVVVDAAGNVVSMTTSVEAPFGSGRMAGGFFLNNQLTDFAFVPRDEAGALRPNAVAAHKRPRSSMSPTIILDNSGQFVMATGSPGGNSIIAYTAKTIVGVLDWGLSPQEAADLPNVVARGDTVGVESAFDPALRDALESRGFNIEAGRGENSGIHIVLRHADGTLEGAADTRRDGTAEAP